MISEEDNKNNNNIMLKECESLLKSLSNKNIKDVNLRKQNARNRWKLLARAILSDSKREQMTIKKLSTTPINIISNVSQSFDGFDLVKIEQLKKDDESIFAIKIDVGSKRYECNVHVEKLWTVKDLIGFNNTGNITFWSSEAALAHYAMENLPMFDKSFVLELGGGMFCLSGLMIAKYSNAFAVHLTDGNHSSLQNVKKSVILNDFDCFIKSSGTSLFKLADYWKSQERIYCDYCKCYITNNKPSVDFHNNGKRHKANVQKKLSEIGKKSEADRKAQNKLDDELRKINEAAMKSYSKDISIGIDITARAIGHASSSSKAIDPIALPFYDEEDGPNVSKRPCILSATKSDTITEQKQSLWCEAVTDDGHTYYWNVKTNESVWEKPKEGFMTLKEYNKLYVQAVEKQEEALQKDLKYHMENAEEIASRYKREQLKKYQAITKATKDSEETAAGSTSKNYATEFDNCQKIGSWQTVEAEPEEKVHIDLGLPKQKHEFYAVATVSTDEPVVKKFKEKTITSLDSDEVPSVFKKRKFGGNRNIRKTNDDSI